MEELLQALMTNPDEINAIVTGVIQTAKPIIYSAGGELLAMYKDFVGNDEYYAVEATNYKKKYDALTKAGFKPTQAMDVLLATIRGTKEYAAKISGASVKLN